MSYSGKSLKTMKKIILLLLAPALMFGCKENSPLSDVELNNPALISPEITLTKHENELGRTNTELVVYLNDKNNNSIDLLKGSVLLNDKPLGVRTEIGGAPYYSLDNIELVNKRKYVFEISLADNKAYTCTINSPEKPIGQFNVADYHNVGTPLVVSWDRLNANGSIYYLEIRNEDRTEEIELSSIQTKVGSYAIPSDVLALINNGQRSDVFITLKSVTSGKVDPRFNGGSIQIVESICKQVTLGYEDSSMGDDIDYEVYTPK